MRVIVPRWLWDAWIEEHGREPVPGDVPGGACTAIEVTDVLNNLSYVEIETTH